MTKALVLSGGGVKGAYQAGAVKALMSSRSYDIYSGTSVGAINCGFLSQFNYGDEHDATRELFTLWSRMRDDSVYSMWYGGSLWYLPVLWKGSLYDSSPINNLIRSRIKPDCVKWSGKRLRVSAVSVSTMKTQVWTERDADILDGICASCAFPGAFPEVAARGDLWMDGVVRDNTPLAAAIMAGATDVDVICCDPEVIPRTGDSILGKIKHVVDIVTNEATTNDLEAAERYNLLVAAGLEPARKKVRINVIRPDHVLVENNFDFNESTIRSLLRKGQQDAETHLGASRSKQGR